MFAPGKSSSRQSQLGERQTYLEEVWENNKLTARKPDGAKRAMIANRRDERRSVIWTDATLDLGLFGKRTCDVHDLSVNGARLVLNRARKLPKRFYLTVHNGSSGSLARRRCQVCWQDGQNVGIHFRY